MRARAWSLAALLVAATASADPKPTPVDIKPYKDKLLVLQDAAGGIYVVMGARDGDAHMFYGTGKTLYEQIVMSRSYNEDSWDVHVVAPRVEEFRNASVIYRQDHTYALFCGSVETGLTQLTGDKAKAVLDKYQFVSTAMVRKSSFFGRDDHGTYYYVDHLRGGKGYRLFVGRKGAMKELAITDLSSDTAGQVFVTKAGELKLTPEGDNRTGVWMRGEKKESLTVLEPDWNSPIIYSQLGIYTFIGTVCETYEPH